MPGNAPVDHVGGNQERGPWPADVEEIVESKAYRRPVRLSDGSTQEREVTVTGVNDILDEDGNPTTGYVLTFQYDDPTLGGGQ